MKLDVIYMDNHLLVVNKQQGLLSQGDETGDVDLVAMAKEHLKKKFNKPGNVFVGLVHRLDRPASGVLALARTSKAASRLSAQFRDNLPKKRYFAMVEGNCEGEGVCENYLIKRDKGVRVTSKNTPSAQYAELSWKAVAWKGSVTLVEVLLKTGRPHQIRAQLSHMGFPILGDFKYGAKKELDGKNLALHCFFLSLSHPVKDETMKWVARTPRSWSGRFGDEMEYIINSAIKRN
jgi:23S rRNA pseudouridine1911/1915/1917 synthase